MANIRAYKLAEELGMDRNEFVERAKALGVELKSAMASVNDAEALLLRDKLGAKSVSNITEARVDSGGGAVIRRRKKKSPEPPAAPRQVEESIAEAPVVTPVAVPSIETEAAVIDEEVTSSTERPEAEPVSEEDELTAPVVDPAPDVAEKNEEGAAKPAPPAAPGPDSPDRARTSESVPHERKGSTRKQFKEVVNLREQEQIARDVTSRTTGRPQQVVAVNKRSFAQRKKSAKTSKVASSPPKKNEVQKRAIRIDKAIQVSELAKQLGAKAADLQGRLMGHGTMVSINQAIDSELAGLVAKEFGFEVQDVGFQEKALLGPTDTNSLNSTKEARCPVVTVMGHVDHGKTSLLDALREANVVAGEAGGITQHIGAYQARAGESLITFIDTPGHAAFTAMRARGAEVTDIVILVVAANDGIMPQTIEAIDHAKAAGVPIVVAVNKCDLPDANSQVVRQRLMEHDLVPEEFGGDVQCVDISALQKTGLDALLEAVVLQAELLELQAEKEARAEAVVLEARLDKGRGPVATVLVREGTLRRGDTVVVDTTHGRVRSILNDRGDEVKEAGPATPVQLVGLGSVPGAGQILNKVDNERAAKQIVQHREAERRKLPGESQRPEVTLDTLFANSADGGPRELRVVIKADTQGSAEALKDSLLSIESDKVKLDVIHNAVGAISESDVQLAKASEAIVIGFHVRADNAGRKASESQGVDIRTYRIIYEAIDEVRASMAGLLPPNTEEKYLGRAEVRQLFTIPKVGTIAGCMVSDGTMKRAASCRLLRDGVQIYEGNFSSLKRFKDDVREVQSGFECGISIDGYNDLKVQDVVEAFEFEEKPAEL